LCVLEASDAVIEASGADGIEGHRLTVGVPVSGGFRTRRMAAAGWRVFLWVADQAAGRLGVQMAELGGWGFVPITRRDHPPSVLADGRLRT
jgi:hypothetical protein